MKSDNRIGWCLDVIIIAILLLSIPDWDYGFYEFARPCLSILLGWSAFIAFTISSTDTGVFIFFSSIIKALLAFFFMPKEFSFGIYLDKEGWVILDIISAIFMLICIIHKFKKRD